LTEAGTSVSEWTTFINCLYNTFNGQNILPPSKPSDRPINIFANIDPRIAFVVSNLNPSLSNIDVALIASNRSVSSFFFLNFIEIIFLWF